LLTFGIFHAPAIGTTMVSSLKRRMSQQKRQRWHLSLNWLRFRG
jgi:hypothetical protein